MAGLPSVVRIMIAKHPSTITIGNFEKNTGLLLKGPGNYTAQLGLQGEVEVGGKEKQHTHKHAGQGVLLLLGQMWGPRISGAHSLLANLKHKSKNLKPGKRKKSVQMVSYQNQPRSQKQRSLNGEGGLALYLILWLAVCSLDIAILEVDVSLKWILWQSKLKPGAGITKSQCLGFTL